MEATQIKTKSCEVCGKLMLAKKGKCCSDDCDKIKIRNIWNKIQGMVWRKTKHGKFKRRMCDIKRRDFEYCIIHQWTPEEFKSKLEATKGFCCGYNKNKHFIGIENLSLDHKYPISRAYKDYLKTRIKRTYTINDIQFLCNGCNASKKDKLLIENKSLFSNQLTTITSK